MGSTKNNLFTEDQNDFSILAKALAHPARIAILQKVLQSETCINSDLVLETGLAQATVSQHLKELKDAGLIQGTIEGVKICYCINPKKWEEAKHLFADFFTLKAKCDEDCC